MKPIDVSYPLADALEGLKQKILNDQFVGWSDYQPVGQALDDLRAQLAALTSERDALRRQLAAATQWTPVNGDESERIMCACPYENCYRAVEWDGTSLTIYVDVSEFDAGLPSLFTRIDLPENVRLCRRAENERDDLRRQLAAAQAWQPVGAADPDIVCAHGTIVQAHGTSLAIGGKVTPDSDELVWTVAELPAGYALCTRQEPPA